MPFPLPPLANDLLLRAVNGEALPRVPVWLMRQAGRSDPEYLAYRERAGLSLYELFRHPEHAVRISLLPRRIGVDAIILYQDILTPLEPMGAVFHFTPGPTLAEPVRTPAQIEALRPCDPAASLGFIAEALGGLRSELAGALPVLGFGGAPFTLAAFMIEGGSPGPGLPNTFALLREQPRAFATLLERLTEMAAAYLRFQVENGAHAVQLFESVGDRIPRDVYETYVQPSHERIFAALPTEVPGILFVRGSPFPDLMLQSGAAVVSLGAEADLAQVLREGGGRVAVQGNVDNHLLAEGTGEAVEAAVRRCIAATGGRRHILNLSHGLLPQTPFANVKRFVQAARAVRLDAGRGAAGA